MLFQNAFSVGAQVCDMPHKNTTAPSTCPIEVLSGMLHTFTPIGLPKGFVRHVCSLCVRRHLRRSTFLILVRLSARLHLFEIATRASPSAPRAIRIDVSQAPTIVCHAHENFGCFCRRLEFTPNLVLLLFYGFKTSIGGGEIQAGGLQEKTIRRMSFLVDMIGNAMVSLRSKLQQKNTR